MRRARRRLLAGCLSGAVAVVMCACGGAGASPAGAPTTDHFDSARAFADLRMQVRLGPRPSGSAASRALAERLRARIPNGRFEAVPGGLRNVVGHLSGAGAPILLAAHYDTKDLPGFVGANDGAGGTAVVLQVARALRAGRRACQREVRFAFFDGEESPPGSSDFLADGLRGSKAYAGAHAKELHAVVVADFVADRDLAIPRDSSSTPALWARLRASASAVGAARAFPDRTGVLILDDHTPFLQRGLPAIDLIDFDYPYFHTTADTLDKVSALSLDRTGEALVELLRRMREDTCPRG